MMSRNMDIESTMPDPILDLHDTMSRGYHTRVVNGQTCYIIHAFNTDCTGKEDQLDPEIFRKKSAYEKRNPNQPFYAGIAGHKKRRK